MFSSLDDSLHRTYETPPLFQRVLRFSAIAAASALLFGLLIFTIAWYG